jgi:predicted RNA-binding protein with PUA-like domain
MAISANSKITASDISTEFTNLKNRVTTLENKSYQQLITFDRGANSCYKWPGTETIIGLYWSYNIIKFGGNKLFGTLCVNQYVKRKFYKQVNAGDIAFHFYTDYGLFYQSPFVYNGVSGYSTMWKAQYVSGTTAWNSAVSAYYFNIDFTQEGNRMHLIVSLPKDEEFKTAIKTNYSILINFQIPIINY